KTITLKVKNTDTIRSVIEKICKGTTTTTSEFCDYASILFGTGTKFDLDNLEKTLQDYHIKDGSTIQLRVKHGSRKKFLTPALEPVIINDHQLLTLRNCKHTFDKSSLLEYIDEYINENRARYNDETNENEYDKNPFCPAACCQAVIHRDDIGLLLSDHSN